MPNVKIDVSQPILDWNGHGVPTRDETGEQQTRPFLLRDAMQQSLDRSVEQETTASQSYSIGKLCETLGASAEVELDDVRWRQIKEAAGKMGALVNVRVTDAIDSALASTNGQHPEADE